MDDTPDDIQEDVPESTVGDMQSEPEAASPTHYNHHSSTVDKITDRTGELLEQSVAVAREFPLVRTGTITDPRDGTQAHVIIDGAGVRAVPQDVFQSFREVPLARTGTAQVTRIDSLIELIERHKVEKLTTLFVDESSAPGSMTVVVDYHSEAVPPSGDFPGGHIPQNMKHRLHYPFPLSDEWKAWTQGNKQMMSVGDLAEFLEDRITEIRDASEVDSLSGDAAEFVKQIGGKVGSPTDMYHLSKGIQISEASEVVSAKKIASGEVQIALTTEHTETRDATGATFEVPGLFLIAIPVFANGDVAYRMVVRFRYRNTGGAPKFFYELWRPDLVMKAAIDEAVERVTGTTGIPAFFGKPEV